MHTKVLVTYELMSYPKMKNTITCKSQTSIYKSIAKSRDILVFKRVHVFKT